MAYDVRVPFRDVLAKILRECVWCMEQSVYISVSSWWSDMIYLYDSELLLGRSHWGDRERILIRLAEVSKITPIVGLELIMTIPIWTCSTYRRLRKLTIARYSKGEHAAATDNEAQIMPSCMKHFGVARLCLLLPLTREQLKYYCSFAS